MQGWLKTKAAILYAGHKDERTLKAWFKNGLRHVRLPSGTILTKPEWIDQFLELHEVKVETRGNEIDRLVDETTKGFS